jgi:hypothetical protein
MRYLNSLVSSSENGGLLESLKTSLSHKNNHFAKAYKHAESILK